MKLIKLTHYLSEDKIYINSDCILSCEHKNHNESETWYTRVGLLYENRFDFWYVKETIEDIQSQLEGNPAEVYIDKHKVGQRIKAIRLAKGMNQKEFAKFTSVTVTGVQYWEYGRNLPSKERLKIIADLAGITVQKLLEE